MNRFKFIVLLFLVGGCSFDSPVERPVDGEDPDQGQTLDMREADGDFTPDMPTPSDMPLITDTGMDAATDTGADLGEDLGMDMATDPIQNCGGMQVDTRTSLEHCGACDNGCDSVYGTCNNGQCECYSPYDSCGSENVCTLNSADPKNCGTCGNECGDQEVCYQGGCVCYPGFELCGGKCVDVESNPQHCGACDVPCNGNACKDGSCRGNDDCGFGIFECRTDGGTACTTTEWNPAYCNANIFETCGEVCGPGQICGQPSLIKPLKCRDYRPALGCTSCPCDDCNGEFCLEVDDPADVVFCVDNS